MIYKVFSSDNLLNFQGVKALIGAQRKPKPVFYEMGKNRTTVFSPMNFYLPFAGNLRFGVTSIVDTEIFYHKQCNQAEELLRSVFSKGTTALNLRRN